VDPSGYWTIGFDISINVGILGAFFSGGLSVTIDQSGDYALSVHIQGGGGTIAIGGGISSQLQVTNAGSVEQVSSGTTASVGGSGGGVAGELLFGDGWLGTSFGRSFGSFELHGTGGLSIPIARGNICSDAFLFLNESMEIASLELGGLLGSEFGALLGIIYEPN